MDETRVTLGMELERRRLEHRVRRLRRVLHELRARERGLGPDAPEGLRSAITGFGSELGEAEKCLREMAPRRQTADRAHRRRPSRRVAGRATAS